MESVIEEIFFGDKGYLTVSLCGLGAFLSKYLLKFLLRLTIFSRLCFCFYR